MLGDYDLQSGINMSYNSGSATNPFAPTNNNIIAPSSNTSNTSNGSNLNWNDVENKISTITNSASDVATKVLEFQTLKANTEASIRNYELAIKNSNNQLEIAQWQYQIQQLQYQQSVIDNEVRALQVQGNVSMTKWIVGGVAVVAVLGIVIYATKYNKK